MPDEQHGFTLIELIMVIVILGIIAGLGGYLLTAGIRAFYTGQEITVASQRMNMAFDRINRDLRGASRASVNIPIASTLTFTDSNGNAISYTLAGTTIMRQQNGGTLRALIGNISALTFSSPTINGANYVTINVTMTRGGGTFASRTSIFPRNS